MVTACVLDCSIALTWVFGDEFHAYAEHVWLAVRGGEIRLRAPAIWPLEVTNALITAERRRRLSAGEADQAGRLLQRLSVDVDSTGLVGALDVALPLARKHGLSAYDASYLGLALADSCRLATLDARLAAAARAEGVFFE